VLRPAHLRRIDAAAAANAELRWMRRAVADHPSANIAVLESMVREGIADDEELKEAINRKLAALRTEREHRKDRRAHRRQAKRRLYTFFERKDPVGFALHLYREGSTSLDDLLEQFGVGPTCDDASVDTSNPATDRHRKTGHHASELRLVIGIQ
jgi:hypothetical protein